MVFRSNIVTQYTYYIIYYMIYCILYYIILNILTHTLHIIAYYSNRWVHSNQTAKR